MKTVTVTAGISFSFDLEISEGENEQSFAEKVFAEKNFKIVSDPEDALHSLDYNTDYLCVNNQCEEA